MSARSEGGTTRPEGGAKTDLPYRLTYMFHPTILVPDLTASEEWYETVFGLPSTRRDVGFAAKEQDPDNRTDFSTFTMIRDILMDYIDPNLFISRGVQRFPSVEEAHLEGYGWYVDGIEELYHRLRNSGVKVVGMSGEDNGDEPPTARQSSAVMFLTLPDDIGLEYQFISPQFPNSIDPRMVEGWELGPRREDDPLGIDFTSHHTTLTTQPERMQKLFVDLFGGTIIHQGRNEALETLSVYVRLADGVYEIAVPDVGTAAYADLEPRLPNDCYHSITLKVADLDKVRRRLEAHNVALRADTGSMIITDPKTSDGVPWGFTADTLPGDDRA